MRILVSGLRGEGSRRRVANATSGRVAMPMEEVSRADNDTRVEERGMGSSAAAGFRCIVDQCEIGIMLVEVKTRNLSGEILQSWIRFRWDNVNQGWDKVTSIKCCVLARIYSYILSYIRT